MEFGNENEEFEFRKRLEAEAGAPMPASPNSEPPAPPPESWGKTLTRGALGALGPIGLAGGAMLGAPAGGVTAVPAAALGYAAGKNLERLGKKYLLNETDDAPAEAPSDMAKQTVSDAAHGAMYEMGGQIAGKALGGVSDYIANRLGRTATQQLVPATPTAPPPQPVDTSIIDPSTNKPFTMIPEGSASPAPQPPPPLATKPPSSLGTRVALGAGTGVMTSDSWDPKTLAKRAAVGGAAGALLGGVPDASNISGLLRKPSAAIQTLAQSNLFSSEQLARIATSPFAQTLRNAAQTGGAAAIATVHYILQQTDPQYQKILKEEQE